MLTTASVERQKWDPNGSTVQVLWDTKITGFGARVFETGRKTFVLRYSIGGKRRMETLGAYGVLTVDQARKLAREHRVTADSGEDPFKKNPDGLTWKDYAPMYMREHGSHKKSGPKDHYRIEKHLLPSALGDTPLKKTDREAVAELFRKVGQTAPYEANRLLSLISIMWNTAARLGLVSLEAVNPTKWIKRYPEEKRDRFVKDDEMPTLCEAISEEKSPYTRALFLLYMLTGIRKVAMTEIKWAHVDLKKGAVSVYKTKAKRDLHVPLSSEAQEVLRGIPRMVGNDYVFPGSEPGSHLITVDRAWKRIKTRAKAKGTDIDDVRIHDLRRTFGSWLASSGVSIATIMELMDISQYSTAKTYMRFKQEALTSAVNLVGAKMLGDKGG
jgi:integrase